MAQKVNIVVTCDMCEDDNGTDTIVTRTLSVDGHTVEIDVCETHSDALTAATDGFLDNGRRVSGSKVRAISSAPKQRRSSNGGGTGPDPAVVREWALAGGMDVPARGRLPKAVIEAYEAANA